MLHAVIKKILLAVDDTFDDTIDRLTAVFDIPQKIDRGADLFFYEVFGFFRRVRLIDELMICRAYSQTRTAVIGEVDHVLALDLFDVHLGCDEYRFFRGVPATGIWIEHADLIDLFIELMNIPPRVFGEVLEPMRLKIF